MPTLPERVAPALLVVAGLLTLLPLLAGTQGASGTAQPLVLHWQFMMGMLGLGLLAAAFVPALRMAVVSGAVMSKLALLLLAAGAPGAEVVGQASMLDVGALALLLAAGALFWHAASQQARWDGVRP